MQVLHFYARLLHFYAGYYISSFYYISMPYKRTSLKEQGFDLNKSEFQDALNLRYDKPLKNMPSKCACGKTFSVTHAMSCALGGFVIARHDNVKNFEAKLLKQVCNDVQLEPPLQPTTGYSFRASANTRDDARLDVRAKGFWRQGQNAYFDVRITNSDAASQRAKSIETIHSI